MKKISIILLIMTGFLAACEDYLELSPDMGMEESTVFNDFNSVRGYLDNGYHLLFDYTRWNAQNLQRTHIAAISDEAASTYDWSAIRSALNTGDWYRKAGPAEVGYGGDNIGNLRGNVIPNSFRALRVMNKIINKLPNVSGISDDQKEEILGQAYFLRAWHYFEVLKRWGGLPIYDKVYAPDSDFDLKRLTYKESTEWMLTDLDKAIEMLPDRWPEDQVGRATKVSAMALKSMATLYGASPLMQNGLNSITQQDYDQEWCKDAARYAHEVITYIDSNLPEKRMKGSDLGAGTTQEERDSAYRHVFYHSPEFVSSEALWANNSGGMDREIDMAIHFYNSRFTNRAGNWGWAITTPSQNLVDKFEVINPDDGKAYPIDHPQSGYSIDDPYSNRDPRFYNNILYPGRQWGFGEQNEPWFLEPWEGGGDYSNDWSRTVPTGYMCVKWVWPEAKFKRPNYGDYNYSASYIRTTQVYLDYAEAINEAYGPNNAGPHTMTAVEAVNKVRERVGMPPVLQELTSSKETFRNRIRDERAVELMYENHRWFDIRRWMIAESVLSTGIMGMHVEDLTPGEEDVSKKEFSFEKRPVDTEIRVFNTKHYWYPIAADHTDRLMDFKQNPGW